MTSNSVLESDVPDDLGLKLGTMDEVIWTNVLKEAKVLLEESERAIVVQKGMIELAEERIAEEKRKV